MICLLFDDDHKFRVSEIVRALIIESLNEDEFEEMLKNDECLFTNRKI
jgi:hypothetical protein